MTAPSPSSTIASDRSGRVGEVRWSRSCSTVEYGTPISAVVTALISREIASASSATASRTLHVGSGNGSRFAMTASLPRRRRRHGRGPPGLRARRYGDAMTRVTLVPHTHWDREWYEPFSVFSERLVAMMDTLLELAAEGFPHFHLDGQT